MVCVIKSKLICNHTNIFTRLIIRLKRLSNKVRQSGPDYQTLVRRDELSLEHGRNQTFGREKARRGQ